jgi:hypothetical protein
MGDEPMKTVSPIVDLYEWAETHPFLANFAGPWLAGAILTATFYAIVLVFIAVSQVYTLPSLPASWLTVNGTAIIFALAFAFALLGQWTNAGPQPERLLFERASAIEWSLLSRRMLGTILSLLTMAILILCLTLFWNNS